MTKTGPEDVLTVLMSGATAGVVSGVAAGAVAGAGALTGVPGAGCVLFTAMSGLTRSDRKTRQSRIFMA